MRVAKWGNSPAVRLPVALVQELGISDGDALLLPPAKRKARQPAGVTVERQPEKLEQLQVARRYRASWPADFGFDRDEANAGALRTFVDTNLPNEFADVLRKKRATALAGVKVLCDTVIDTCEV